MRWVVCLVHPQPWYLPSTRTALQTMMLLNFTLHWWLCFFSYQYLQELGFQYRLCSVCPDLCHVRAVDWLYKESTFIHCIYHNSIIYAHIICEILKCFISHISHFSYFKAKENVVHKPSLVQNHFQLNWSHEHSINEICFLWKRGRG